MEGKVTKTEVQIDRHRKRFLGSKLQKKAREGNIRVNLFPLFAWKIKENVIIG